MNTFVDYQKDLLKLVDELDSAQSIQSLTDKFEEVKVDNSIGLSDVRRLLDPDLLDKIYAFLRKVWDKERGRTDLSLLDDLRDNSKKDSALDYVIEKVNLYNTIADLMNQIGEFITSIQEVKNEEECLKFTEIADLFSVLRFKLRSLKRVCGEINEDFYSSIPNLTLIKNL